MFRFLPISTDEVQTLRYGYDANQQPPEFSISNGGGVPCRHCLDEVTPGQPLLTLAYRPFKHIQPYAELGPIFLHANDCAPWSAEKMPPVIENRSRLLIRGYSDQERIVSGTGRIVPLTELNTALQETMAVEEVSYIHIRCEGNNCYLCRVESG